MANFKRPHLYAPKYVLNPPEIPWFPGPGAMTNRSSKQRHMELRGWCREHIATHFLTRGKFDSTSILWANFIPLIPYGRTVNEDSLENLIGFL